MAKPSARWFLVLGAAAVIALIATGYPMYIHHVRQSANRPSYPPSWADIQRLVKANTQWEEYKKGGDYLQALQAGTYQYPKAGDPTSDARPVNAISARVTVDFLRTLTPAQVTMLKDKLPYAKLTPDQQKLLCLEPGYHYSSDADTTNSYIRVELRKFGEQDPYADFFWCTRSADGKETIISNGGNNFWLDNVAKWQQPWN